MLTATLVLTASTGAACSGSPPPTTTAPAPTVTISGPPEGYLAGAQNMALFLRFRDDAGRIAGSIEGGAADVASRQGVARVGYRLDGFRSGDELSLTVARTAGPVTWLGESATWLPRHRVAEVMLTVANHPGDPVVFAPASVAKFNSAAAAVTRATLGWAATRAANSAAGTAVDGLDAIAAQASELRTY